MIKHGEVIQKHRREFLDYVNELWGRSEIFSSLKLKYDHSAITENRLRQYFEAEKAIGYTLVGPHKDDVIISDRDRDLASYGSRGEQRMAVLALKMGEIYYLERFTKEKVLLLLDDVFSELDDVHKTEIDRLTMGRQVVATTPDKDDLKFLKGSKSFELLAL